MIYEIDIMDNVMVLFDEDGSSFESATLTTYGEAIQTIRRWVKRYPLNVGNAHRMLSNHFLVGTCDSMLGKPIVDPLAQKKTAWTPMSVPGRENADGTETPTAWFAYNRETRQSVRFANFKEATAFCFHPDNQR